jgi:hypothetical protein
MMPFRGNAMARARRKKKDKLRAHKEAKRRARMGVGMPPPERVIIDKRLKPEKHKKRIDDADAG